MGIKGLFKFLQRYAPSAITVVSRDDLRYHAFSVDASQTVHKYVRALLGSGMQMSMERGTFTAHLMAVLNKTLFYLRLRIFPIYVFDGHSDPLKMETLEQRQRVRDSGTTAASQFVFEAWMVADIKHLLDIMGIPWIQARGEADPQCARLTRAPHRLAWAVISDDGDMLTFGARRMIRELDSRSNAAVVITLSAVLRELNLTQSQFVDLCILMGCDYCPTIKGIGPVGALALVREQASIRQWAQKQQIDKRWIQRFTEVHTTFMNNTTITDPVNVRSQWTPPRFDKLLRLLTRYKFSRPEDKVAQLTTAYTDWRTEERLRRRRNR